MTNILNFRERLLYYSHPIQKMVFIHFTEPMTATKILYILFGIDWAKAIIA